MEPRTASDSNPDLSFLHEALALAHMWVNSRALGEGHGQLKLWAGKPDLPKMPAGITFPKNFMGKRKGETDLRVVIARMVQVMTYCCSHKNQDVNLGKFLL